MVLSGRLWLWYSTALVRLLCPCRLLAEACALLRQRWGVDTTRQLGGPCVQVHAAVAGRHSPHDSAARSSTNITPPAGAGAAASIGALALFCLVLCVLCGAVSHTRVPRAASDSSVYAVISMHACV